jgi:outer membrane protein OmpA-like peptidoglycan-associated protein
MKSTFLRIIGIIVVAFIVGCAGETKELHMRDAAGTTQTIVFPNGTVFGGASKEQASTLAQIFVDSHNMHMQEMAEIKGMGKKSLENQQRLLELSQKNLETAERALQMLEQLSKRQGTGEITLFFPVGSSEIRKGSHEFERLVNFADYLSRESKGRKALFISIGSASAFGDRKVNERLGKKRSEAPVDVMDKYLVNIPHQFFKVYGIGDMYSPKNVTMKEHERYQHARIIAFFETDQIPLLPEEPKQQ